jgi:hypothetical protein
MLTIGAIPKVIPLHVQIASGPSYRFNLANGSETPHSYIDLRSNDLMEW